MKAKENLVVADLHVGYERELEEKGINIPDQAEKMIEPVSEILADHDIQRLIINGDFKHNIPKATWQEYRDIPRMVDEWLKTVGEVHLIPGNHDGGITEYLPSDVFIHESSGTVIDGIGFFHGHAIPSEEVLSTENIVLAHTHPAVELIDSFKNKEKKECWVRFEYKWEDGAGEGIIIPHHNPLLGGTSINKKEEHYLGPFLKDERLENERVYLLDGTYLGQRDDLIPDR